MLTQNRCKYHIFIILEHVYFIAKDNSTGYAFNYQDNFLFCCSLVTLYLAYIKNRRVVDGVIDCDLTEYSSHALADSVHKEKRNERILVTRSRNGE